MYNSEAILLENFRSYLFNELQVIWLGKAPSTVKHIILHPFLTATVWGAFKDKTLKTHY